MPVRIPIGIRICLLDHRRGMGSQTPNTVADLNVASEAILHHPGRIPEEGLDRGRAQHRRVDIGALSPGWIVDGTTMAKSSTWSSKWGKPLVVLHLWRRAKRGDSTLSGPLFSREPSTTAMPTREPHSSIGTSVKRRETPTSTCWLTTRVRGSLSPSSRKTAVFPIDETQRYGPTKWPVETSKTEPVLPPCPMQEKSITSTMPWNSLAQKTSARSTMWLLPIRMEKERPSTAAQVCSVASADLDGDGIDKVYSGSDETPLERNNLELGSSNSTFNDVDGNGDPTLFHQLDSGHLRFTGRWPCMPSQACTPARPSRSCTADVDGDGLAEFFLWLPQGTSVRLSGPPNRRTRD